MDEKILVISTSLNPDSKSLLLAQEVIGLLQQKQKEADLIDLKEFDLPHCDGGSAYGHPHVATLTKKIEEAACVILAVPIYNYDAGSAAKNLIELTGSAWQEKVVGFLCAAGGKSSYMSIMSLANSLMLDFRCVVIPSFVYADGSSFKANKLEDAEISRRIEALCRSAIRFSQLASVPVR
jgi:FMN reductase